MADILPRHIIFGFIGFVAILMFGLVLIQDFASKDSSLLNDNRYGTFYSKIGAVNGSMNSSLASFSSRVSSETPAKEDLGAFGWLSSLVGTAWSIIKNIGVTFQFGYDAINGVGMILGVPGWVTGIILGAIGIVIAFAIISALFQKDV